MRVLIGFVLTQLFIGAAVENYEDDDSWMHPRTSDFGAYRARFRKSPEENDAHYWYDVARAQLQVSLSKKPITTRAKSTILFLGDGMSIPTITAARIYGGQMNGDSGEESSIFFEKFPYIGLSKTYSVSNQVADSASTSTAYLGGVKTNTGMLGLTAAVSRGDCKASLNESTHVPSILKWAQDVGMSTGVVTTTRVTHASPGGAYAHVAEREWESDADVAKDKKDPMICKDIAHQLLYGETGQNINVILGGGRRNFLPMEVTDEDGNKGKRLDGRNLINEWLAQKSDKGSYIYNRNQLMTVNAKSTDYILGLFSSSNLKYHLERDPSKEPTLSEMTEVAIKILRKNPKGYFLFVEGGRIDHGHHSSKALLALDETVQMADAVQLASEITSDKETLIVVTADHAHTMSISGYPPRGETVFGIAGNSSKDLLPYTTLAYATGPGYKKGESKKKCRRHDVRKDKLGDINYKFPSVAPLKSEAHGGEDVAVFARGPWSHLFVGNYEQNFIMHAMCYAMGIGPASNWTTGRQNSIRSKLNDLH